MQDQWCPWKAEFTGGPGFIVAIYGDGGGTSGCLAEKDWSTTVRDELFVHTRYNFRPYRNMELFIGDI